MGTRGVRVLNLVLEYYSSDTVYRGSVCTHTQVYQIAVKIKPLYLTHNTYYFTSNTTRIVQH
jgi:hypothetical protein